MEQIAITVRVIDSITNEEVDPQEWLQREDKESAEWLVIRCNPNIQFKLHKKELGSMPWQKAIETAAFRCDGGRPGTRFELLTLYDAKYVCCLNDLLERIGGDILSGYYWTEEEDADPQSSATYAWYVSLYYGYVYFNTKTSGYQVRLISAF